MSMIQARAETGTGSDVEVDLMSVSEAPLSETGGRRLVICCDGTWSQPNNPLVTNVVKIARGVTENVPPEPSAGQSSVSQIVYYDSGVGTSGFLDSLTGGGFGHGLELNVEQAYRFLVHNYRPGDKIYIFGFSRGAYTARSLAGLIRQCSILKKRNAGRIKEGYDAYRSADLRPNAAESRQWRTDYSHTMPVIEFLGVWDTVGALGIPANRVVSMPKYHVRSAIEFLKKLPFTVNSRLFKEKDSDDPQRPRPSKSVQSSAKFRLFRGRHRFHDMELSKYVKTAYHALAVDERRPIFTAALWDQKPDFVPGTNGRHQLIRQAWFPGDHSDVGGGNRNERNSAITLRWVAEAAHASGLVFEDNFWEEIQSSEGKSWDISRSPSTMWLLAGSKRRAMGVNDGETAFIHDSTLKRAADSTRKYAPANPGYEWLVRSTVEAGDADTTVPLIAAH